MATSPEQETANYQHLICVYLPDVYDKASVTEVPLLFAFYVNGLRYIPMAGHAGVTTKPWCQPQRGKIRPIYHNWSVLLYQKFTYLYLLFSTSRD